VALPVAIFFRPDILNVSLLQAVMLAVNGMLIVFSVLFYFYALSYDDASSVVPFYQTIPVFAFILGYLFLGETITVSQGVASLVIILGALVLSFDFGSDARRFKKEVVILMLGASFLYALNGVIFKFIALDSGFWTSTFWGLIGRIILGCAFLAFVPVYRRQFFAMVKENNFAVLGLNSLSETMFIVGED
jgi:drug/metabolite transporter (DMT)-like permease